MALCIHYWTCRIFVVETVLRIIKDIMKFRIFALILVLLFLFSIDIIAQCPMCRMAAESNLENGGTQARGLNDGILYMLSMPYILIATLAFIWYRNRKKENTLELGE